MRWHNLAVDMTVQLIEIFEPENHYEQNIAPTFDNNMRDTALRERIIKSH